MSKLFKLLDNLEKTEPETSTGGDVLHLMEEIADRPDGLKALVKRYATSDSPIIVRSLSFLLAQKSDESSVFVSNLTFDLVKRLQRKDDISTLINCLTAIHRQLIAHQLQKLTIEATRILFSFLLHCLASNRLVQFSALELIIRLHQTQLAWRIFDVSEISQLQSMILASIPSLNEDLLGSELKTLSDFLQKKPELPS